MKMEIVKAQVEKLNDFVQAALAKKALPEKEKKAITPFLKMADRLIDLFYKEANEEVKFRHFGTLCAYLSMHYLYVYTQLQEYNTITSFTRRNIGFGSWMENNYLYTLKKLQNECEPLFLKLVETKLIGPSNDDQCLIQTVGKNEALTYKIGKPMQEALTGSSKTFIQAQRNAIVVTYFKILDFNSDNTMTFAKVYPYAGAMAGGLMTGMGGVLVGYFGFELIKRASTQDAEYTRRTLQRNEFDHPALGWQLEMSHALMDEKVMDELLAKPLGYEPTQSLLQLANI